MEPRVDATKHSAEPMKTMYALGKYLSHCGLDHGLRELVKIRASQLNGCAYCIDMHTKDARAAGETEQRIYALNAWRETPFFTAKERAALAWTETVTRLADGVSDADFDEAREHFDEKELVELTWAVIEINAWNRLVTSLRPSVPGTYKVGMHAA